MPKVVLIVGAGAGAGPPLNFPVGKTLIHRLAADLNFYLDRGSLSSGDHVIYRHSLARADSRDLFLAGRELAMGIIHYQSVDEYLWARGTSKALVDLGKAGIASAILSYERDCILEGLDSPDKKGILHACRETWLHKLLSYYLRDCRREDRNTLFDDLVIINFNYDRCIEHYLYHAVKAAFSISGQEAAAVMAGLAIYHPYGTLGRLPWQAPDGRIELRFGESAEVISPFEMGASISTYTERQGDQDWHEAVQSHLKEAERAAFLGFGFHPQNMDILATGIARRQLSVFATTLGESPSSTQVFSRQVRNALAVNGQMEMIDCDCAQLMDQFGRELFR